MAKQRYATEEIIHKPREADVLIGQGQTVISRPPRGVDCTPFYQSPRVV
jgi:hypothetical protein